MIEKSGNYTDSLVGILDRNAQSTDSRIKQWSSRPDRKSTHSYLDIKDASQAFSSLLTQKDIQPRDRVILWGANSPKWVISYFATLGAGAVVVPFDANGEVDFLNRVVEATRPRMIIAGEAQKDKLLPNAGVPIFEMDQVDKIPHQTDNQTMVNILSNDLAEIVFTSGTTGNPKGVMLTHGNILSNVESIGKVIPLKPEYNLLSILPLSHMFEITVGLLTPMLYRSGIVYTDTLQPSSLLQAMRDERITCMAVVPEVLKLFKNPIEKQVEKDGKETQWRIVNMINQFLPLAARRLLLKSLHQRMGGKLEFFVCGGAALDPKLAQSWENFGIKVVQGYGATEASPVVSCDSLSKREHNFVGRPLPGVDVKIAPDGEVLVKGPNVMSGYWENPKASSEVLKNGWYYTGDLGTLDHGRLRLLGRARNMIVLPNGMNVYPEDIEQTLTRQINGKTLQEKTEFYP